MAARNLLARLVVTAATVLLAQNVTAETLFGIYAGAGTWHQNSGGHLQSNGTNVDTSQDMGLGDDDGNVIAVAFEHPIPFVPNVRVQQAKVGMGGGLEIDRDVVLAGVSFIPPGTVDSTLDLKMTDAILYYRLLDDAFSLDLGIEARKLKGSASISGGIYHAEVEFDGTIPML